MKKVLLSGFVIFTFTGYAIHQKYDTEEVPVVTPNITSPIAKSTTPAPTPFHLTNSWKDGRYTGDVTDAYYGNIQVQATIRDGRITDVQFLQYPSDRRTSMMISMQAMPMLRQEAIQSQSAQVDGVSGASQTSAAFIQSLQSALNKAKT